MVKKLGLKTGFWYWLYILFLMEMEIKEDLQPKIGTLFNLCVENQENVSDIGNIEVEAQFEFNMANQQSYSSGKQGESKRRSVLQLRGDWVLEWDSQTSRTLSKFRCEPSKSFEVIRRRDEEDKGDLRAVGLILGFARPKPTIVQLLVMESEREKLQYFSKRLESKYIVQKGFYKIFKPIRRLGRGLTSSVFLTLNAVDKKTYAVKCFNKNGNEGHHVHSRDVILGKEFRIWRSLQHKNILKLITAFQTDNTIYIVTDQLFMTLHTFITRHGFVKRDRIRGMLKEILEGVKYLHDRRIMHRDLKLENIMLKKSDLDDGKLMPFIIDFGLAEYIDKQPYYYLKCGTPGFTAPQILAIESREKAEIYNEKCDMFSFGVIAYTLLCKKMPFYNGKKEEMLERNKQCKIDFPQRLQEANGAEGIDLLKRLLEKDPKKRMSASETLGHPFFSSSVEKKWGSTAQEIPSPQKKK